MSKTVADITWEWLDKENKWLRAEVERLKKENKSLKEDREKINSAIWDLVRENRDLKKEVKNLKEINENMRWLLDATIDSKNILINQLIEERDWYKEKYEHSMWEWRLTKWWFASFDSQWNLVDYGEGDFYEN